MPIQRESRSFESGIDVRAASARRLAVARANLEQCRSAGSNRLRDAVACKCIFEFPAAARADGKSARPLGATLAAALHERPIRSVVRAAL